MYTDCNTVSAYLND